MSPSSLDWLAWWPIILTGLGLIGGAVAWASGAFRTRGTDQQERQKAHEDYATKNAAMVLDSTFKLLNELQEELTRKAEQIKACEALVTTLKAEISSLQERIHALQLELRNQPGLK